jgi:broad specificity phosphatase PhoE
LGTRLPAPAALYTSTLTRAREVAAVLEDLWKLHASEVEAAREIHCGALDGMRLDELQRDFPHLWNLNRAQVDCDFAWPGGESYACFRRRVLAALAGIAAKHPGQRVAVVTHAGVISQVLGSVRGRPPGVWEVDRPDPLTATEVTWDNGAPLSLVRYNDSHWY